MSYIEEIREQPGDPLGGASGNKRRFNVQFIAKANNPEFPFTVANEVVATQIGLALGLNLPAVLNYRIGDENLVFVQMIDRDPTMTKGPPAPAKTLGAYINEHPQEVHGAIIYDLYVANNDRAFGPERRNLLLDGERRLLLYDQGNACYYRNRPHASITAGSARLNAIEANMSAMFDMAHKENHYFEFLTDWRLVEFWCERVRQLPDFLIEGIVDRLPRHLERPADDERDRLKKFLIARKERLMDDIIKWQALFRGMPERGAHA